MMEDSRAFYLAQFLDLVPYRDELLARVWKRLVRLPQPKNYFAGHQFQVRWLATRYALRGDEAAKQSVRKRIIKNLQTGEMRGVENWLLVDRESALQEVVVLFEMLHSPLEDDDGRMIGYAIEEVFGEQWFEEWVKSLPPESRTARLIREDPNIYKRAKEKEQVVRTYEELISTVEENQLPYAARSTFLDNATESEFIKAARNLPSDPRLLAQYLQIFGRERRPWPIEPQPLFQLAKSNSSKVAARSYAVLRKIKSDEVRQFALRNISKRYAGQLAVDLLVLNYLPGDEEIIKERAEQALWPHELHNVLMPLREIIKSHPEIDNSLIAYLYEKQPCSFCRESVVDFMIQRNMVTDDIRLECLHDASEETRLHFGGEKS